jgi:transcriptional regulator with XRE-family HTH domain
MARSFGQRLGQRLRARRLARGLSQAALAEMVGLSPNYIGLLERGLKLPTIDTLACIAKAVGARPAELLDDPRPADDWLDAVVTVAATIPRHHRELALAVLKAIASRPRAGD